MINPKLAQRYSKPKREIIDTVKSHKNHYILYEAFIAWSSLDRFRRMAERNKMFTFGNQLGDHMIHPKTGHRVTEESYLREQNISPLKNNLIRGTIRSIVGVFSSVQTEPVCVSRDRDKQGRGEVMTNAVQANSQINKIPGLNRLQLQYFLISGITIFKDTFGLRRGIKDVWTDTPNLNDIFFDNHMKDPRHWDCHMIGELHDLSIYDVIGKFSDGSKKRADEIKSMYSYTSEQTVQYLENLTYDFSKFRNFYIPQDSSRCRVIEIWRKEAKERIFVHDRLNGEQFKIETSQEYILNAKNTKRRAYQESIGIKPENFKLLEPTWGVDEYWYYYFMTPTGDVLKEGETPYWHEEHPYSFKIYPFYDGQVFPFVSDYIDQQKYINRIIQMQDLVTRTSAKGVLMFPEDCKPDDMSMDEISEAWAAYDGIIYYKPKPGMPAPQQIIVNSSKTGMYDMLNVQLKMFQDVSGVQGALQGQTPASGTPASLFMQQTQNAQTALIDVLDSFKEAREDHYRKTMKLIQQYYDEEKYLNIGGSASKEIIYRPHDIRDAELELSIGESQSTPAYRMIMNDMLMTLMNQQQITLDEVLQVGAFPFADELRQVIQARKDSAQQQQGDPNAQMLPAHIQEQINAGQQQQKQ
jgi:hypothetical protein